MREGILPPETLVASMAQGRKHNPFFGVSFRLFLVSTGQFHVVPEVVSTNFLFLDF